MMDQRIFSCLLRPPFYTIFYQKATPSELHNGLLRMSRDDTQEIYYSAIIKAILDTGNTGYIGQEFVPKAKDDLASLKQGVEICDA